MKKPNLADQIVELRKSLGWVQKQLAEELGVEPLTVSRWERGVSTPASRYHRKRLKELMDEHLNPPRKEKACA